MNVKQQQQKANHDTNCKLREFDIGDTVHICNFQGTLLWLPGSVDKCRCPVSYSVKLQNGTTVKYHVDHFKGHQAFTNDSVESEDDGLHFFGTYSGVLLNHADLIAKGVSLDVTIATAQFKVGKDAVTVNEH